LFAIAIGLAVLPVAAGCRTSARPMHPESPLGHWYRMEPGETLGEVARRNGVLEEDLLEVNGFRSAAEAKAGRTIFVLNGPALTAGAGPPGGTGAAAGAPSAAPPGSAWSSSGGGVTPAAAVGPPARLRWPVEAPRITSLFGSRWGRQHEGIDLQAPIGTPVVAADGGEVVYSGNTVRGYGNMIVLKHADGLMTVYAHNSVLLVKVGAVVRAGDRIALSGQSGHASGPHVHFEVRRAEIPRDPLQFLPGRATKP
jgi:murein DD-endopeptidase MepM/ murein hydrolase activator NlpD